MPNKTLKEFLCECADAIREKTGETSQCCGNDIPNKIREIQTGSDLVADGFVALEV